MRVFLIYLILIFIKEYARSECTTSAELPAEARLRKSLFCNYDKTVRPVKYFENETVVQFKLYPTKIYMDEHQEIIAFQGNILYVWFDAYLKWDPREFEGIEFLRVRSSEIWVPDITVDSWSHSSSALSPTGEADCHLNHMGHIFWFIMTTLKVPCTPDITSYPFDTQNCTLSFSSSGFMGKYVNLTFFDPKHGVELHSYLPSKFWELKKARSWRIVHYMSLEQETAFYPLIKCNFLLQRHAAGHTAIIILPAAVLAGLTLLVFWMDTMYSTRITIAAMVIFSDILYCIYLGVMLPSNGDQVPIIVTFFRDSFVIASFATVVTIFVRGLRLKTSSPSPWLTDLIAKMESIHVVELIFLGEKSAKEEDSVEMIENSKKTRSAWDQAATFVDRVSFILCCFTYVVLLLFYLP